MLTRRGTPSELSPSKSEREKKKRERERRERISLAYFNFIMILYFFLHVFNFICFYVGFFELQRPRPNKLLWEKREIERRKQGTDGRVRVLDQERIIKG